MNCAIGLLLFLTFTGFPTWYAIEYLMRLNRKPRLVSYNPQHKRDEIAHIRRKLNSGMILIKGGRYEEKRFSEAVAGIGRSQRKLIAELEKRSYLYAKLGHLPDASNLYSFRLASSLHARLVRV